MLRYTINFSNQKAALHSIRVQESKRDEDPHRRKVAKSKFALLHIFPTVTFCRRLPYFLNFSHPSLTS